MKNLLFLSILIILLIIKCLCIDLVKRDIINWNGNNWAFGCDFTGRDFANVQIRGEDCGGTCYSNSRCSHFTWTNWNGGTCWLKEGSITQDDAFSTDDPNMVCGSPGFPTGSGKPGNRKCFSRFLIADKIR